MAALKRALPTALAIAAGLTVLAALFLSHPLLDPVGTYLIDTAAVVAAIALFLGLVNVVREHTDRIREHRSGRIYSVVLVLAMLLTLAVGLMPGSGQGSGPSQPVVRWLFEYVQWPIQASLSALLVVLVVTAATRLLRIRNLESAVLLVIVLLVLAGQVTVGLVPFLPDLRDWILNVPALAGIRGILLGVALGTVLTSIRLLLGVDRPYSD